jgi:hypothetical protein
LELAVQVNGDNPATQGLEPVQGAPGRVQIHAREIIAILKAVIAIDIATPFGEEIAHDRTELVRVDTGAQKRICPAP